MSDRGPFGPLEDLDAVQRQALDAALRITGELASLGGDLASTPWLAGPPGAASVDVGRLRADVSRAAESFSELLRALLDVGFDAVDELTRRPPRGVVATVEPGAVAVLRVRAEGTAPRVTQLTSAAGDELDAVVAIRVEGGDAEIEVVVSPSAAPGAYHGLLLAAGAPDVVVPLTVEVPAGGAG
jgi:hypothetical protein